MTREERLASLSAFLRQIRGKRTQKEVAAGIGIDRSAYVNMENSKRGMGEGVARRLAAYYKKPLKIFSPYITDHGQRLKLIEGDGASPGEELSAIAASIDDLARAVELLVAEQGRQADEIVELRRQVEQLPRRVVGNGER